jgi:DNA-binding transcriptional LysR family regulator
MSRELPSLHALRAFEAAARLESVSRAARELHVTHGAVSRQIRALEEELGRPLFARQGRGLALTGAGQHLRDACAAAFGQLRDACTQLRQEGAQAPFVLGCPGSLLARWMIPRLDRLGRDLPEIRLHLSASEGGFDAELAGLDAALLSAEPPLPATWQSFALAGERIGPVLSPRHPRAAALAKAPAQALLDGPLLHTSSRPQAWPDWIRSQGLDPQRLRYGQAFEHLHYLLEAAAAGLGIAIAPAQLVADDLAAGRLLAPWGFTATRAQWLLAAPKRSTDPRVPQLAAWLRAQFAHDTDSE